MKKSYHNKFYMSGVSALTMAMAVAYAPASSAAVTPYAQDWEAVDANNAAALGPFGENFKYFADVWGSATGDATVGDDIFLYGYGPAAAPNGGAAFSAVAGGEGGFYQGAQYLNIYSDYANADQTAGGSCGSTGCTLNTSVFREYTIEAGDIASGLWTLTFDSKSPFAAGIFDGTAANPNGGNINNPQSASAFIKTLDPSAGYATTNDIRVDTTTVSNTDWGQYSISLDLSDAALVGQILQFGFNSVGTENGDSGVFYDNICFDNKGACPGTPNPFLPLIQIEKLTNGNQADGANDADVPRITQGMTVNWTYEVTNTGTVDFTESEIVVFDDQPDIFPLIDSSSDDGADMILSPGEKWTYTASAQALDLANPPTGVTIVPGCNDLRNTYQNIGWVWVAGSEVTGNDSSHYCNPLDSDGDGLYDHVEDSNGNGVVDVGETDPQNPDTDNDGALDGQEDSNGNGIIDAWESDPLDYDSDDDGLTDGYEINISGTDPTSTTILIPGDMNEDGEVNLGDLLLLQRQIMGL